MTKNKTDLENRVFNLENDVPRASREHYDSTTLGLVFALTLLLLYTASISNWHNSRIDQLETDHGALKDMVYANVVDFDLAQVKDGHWECDKWENTTWLQINCDPFEVEGCPVGSNGCNSIDASCTAIPTDKSNCTRYIWAKD